MTFPDCEASLRAAETVWCECHNADVRACPKAKVGERVRAYVVQLEPWLSVKSSPVTRPLPHEADSHRVYSVSDRSWRVAGNAGIYMVARFPGSTTLVCDCRGSAIRTGGAAMSLRFQQQTDETKEAENANRNLKQAVQAAQAFGPAPKSPKGTYKAYWIGQSEPFERIERTDQVRGLHGPAH